MRKHAFLFVMALLLIFFYTFPLLQGDVEEQSVYMEQGGQLLQPQNNVVIAVVDIKRFGLSLTHVSDLPIMRNLHQDFTKLPNVVKTESLLNASRVISKGEDILVSRAIPEKLTTINDEYLVSLMSEMDQFPELTPFVNKKRDTLIYYIYFVNTIPAADIHQNLKVLQNKWKNKLHFDFTGRAPIIAETESLLTGDIELTFPILALMVFGILLLFRSIRIAGISFFLILLSMGGAYGFAQFLKLPDTPLVLLIPVFSLGLLSDYLIHYFYHYLYTSNGIEKNLLRKSLLFPLSLTAISTLTGFFSLSLIKGSGHFQLGIIIAAAVIIVWFGVFFWLFNLTFPLSKKQVMFPRFQNIQVHIFTRIIKFRYLFFLVVLIAMFWGAFQLQNIEIEPYPIKQLPKRTTIKMADATINEQFYGTLPFFLEIDTGEKNGVLKKSTMLQLQKIHTAMDANRSVGYAFSMLTVLKRMHYYFTGSEQALLTDNEYDDYYDSLIEQYLLYYSSSVDPLEYEALLDNSYRTYSIKGLLYYESYEDLARFTTLLTDIENDFPKSWSLGFYGMAEQLEQEHNNLRNNWALSFLTGSFLIFITVLLFYRKLNLALISLIPGVISMLVSFGLINLIGIAIDAFSIIFVAIITGLVVDYSIHTLSAIDQIEKVDNYEDSFREIIGYSGLPIFLSFVTSLLSFFVLFLSSFSGARNLGLILISSLLISFFLSLYLIPLIILPRRLKKES